MTRPQLLAEAVRHSRVMIARFFPGFDDTNHTRQAPGLPNHFAWTLGHLAFYLHRTAERFDGKPLPDDSFLPGTVRGDRHRFGVEGISFNSTPTDDPASFPPAARCVAVFDAAIERLAVALESADDAKFDQLAPWGSNQLPLWKIIIGMINHNGVHCGQLIDLRRALGMGRILG
jgi:hypothetical protein